MAFVGGLGPLVGLDRLGPLQTTGGDVDVQLVGAFRGAEGHRAGPGRQRDDRPRPHARPTAGTHTARLDVEGDVGAPVAQEPALPAVPDLKENAVQVAVVGAHGEAAGTPDGGLHRGVEDDVVAQ